jgi:mRNA-degrading endonuclease toxin of MazEF toxin-antitoxin module
MPALRESLTLCPLTGDDDAPMRHVRPVLLPTPENSLEKVSMVQIDKVITVPLGAVSKPWGQVSDDDLKNISAALAYWLGIS